jgi:hypothetical protein
MSVVRYPLIVVRGFGPVSVLGFRVVVVIRKTNDQPNG